MNDYQTHDVLWLKLLNCKIVLIIKAKIFTNSFICLFIPLIKFIEGITMYNIGILYHEIISFHNTHTLHTLKYLNFMIWIMINHVVVLLKIKDYIFSLSNAKETLLCHTCIQINFVIFISNWFKINMIHELNWHPSHFTQPLWMNTLFMNYDVYTMFFTHFMINHFI